MEPERKMEWQWHGRLAREFLLAMGWLALNRTGETPVPLT